ncbi:MAG: hypothetical protein U0457_07645 [Candidatus Sericytochromatia bacterium]
MKKLFVPFLVSIFLLTACNSPNIESLPLDNATNISSNSNQEYIITAKAIVDRMAKTTNVSDQDKLVKDFKEQIKNSTRATIDNLLSYTVKVLHANTKPNEDIMKHPLIKLVHEAQVRYLDIFVHSAFSKKSDEIFMIAIQKNSAEQEKLVQKFEKASYKSIPKKDLEELVLFVKGENSNIEDFLDPNSVIAKRLLKVLETALKG